MRRTARSLPARDVERILRARRRLKVGPHRFGPELGYPRSTVYGVLRRHGFSRLAHLDRPTAAPVRFERERPGELVHLDVKNRGSQQREWELQLDVPRVGVEPGQELNAAVSRPGWLSGIDGAMNR